MSATSSVLPFLVGYRDQVNIWTSKDGGRSWQIVDYQQSGFATNPANNLGFSDEELTAIDEFAVESDINLWKQNA